MYDVASMNEMKKVWQYRLRTRLYRRLKSADVFKTWHRRRKGLMKKDQCIGDGKTEKYMEVTPAAPYRGNY